MNQLQQKEEEFKRKMEFKNRKQQELEKLREQNKKMKENTIIKLLLLNINIILFKIYLLIII